MAGILQRLLSVLGRSAKDAATEVLEDELRDRGVLPKSSRSRGRSGSSRAGGSSTRSGNRAAGSSRGAGSASSGAGASGSRAGAHDGVSVYDVVSLGLPDFEYAPDPEGDADPGEVVWTWVPYQEDASKGKDRPVLVLGHHGGRLVVTQLTSKDHDADAAQEAHWGRYWHDVGTGDWDPKHRPSEARLDRLLLVDPAVIRREGASMSRSAFDGTVAALREHWAR